MADTSTGVVLPWEQQAIRGDEMPDGMEYPDQILYLCLRMLYAQKRNGIIDRDRAIAEKKRLLDEYKLYKFRDSMEKEWVEIIRLTELARAEFRKNSTVENGFKLIEILEGRHKNENNA